MRQTVNYQTVWFNTVMHMQLMRPSGHNSGGRGMTWRRAIRCMKVGNSGGIMGHLRAPIVVNQHHG